MSEMPRYNPAPTEFSPAQAPVAPPIMNTVFFMLIGAAVLQSLPPIFSVLQMQSDDFRTTLMNRCRPRRRRTSIPSIVDTAIMVSAGTAIVMTVVGVILYVLIGLFLKKGMGWARIVGAILAVVSLSSSWE